MRKQRPWHVGVAIPARNEEDLLPACLRSVIAAAAELGGKASVDIVLAADSSTDRTAEIAAHILGRHGTVCMIDAGAVGVARRIATGVILERYRGPFGRCWIANTDADTCVPPSWLADQLRLAETGIEAIAGTVDVDNFRDHGPEVPGRFKASYRIASDGSHPHIHGANLGFRADVYLQAGGWSGLGTAEDHDLWRRLGLAGARRCSTSRIEVVTSGRKVGRAPRGFADALAAHNETAA